MPAPTPTASPLVPAWGSKFGSVVVTIELRVPPSLGRAAVAAGAAPDTGVAVAAEVATAAGAAGADAGAPHPASTIALAPSAAPRRTLRRVSVRPAFNAQ